MKDNERDGVIVVDARSGMRYTPNPPFTARAVFAVDLPSDLWRDYEFFLCAARDAQDRRNLEMRYRYLRAALFCLFAHFNAFFDLLIDHQKRNNPAFWGTFKGEVKRRSGEANFPRCEHGQFMVVFSDYVSRQNGGTLPTVDLRVKSLRNILAHPVTTKQDVSVDDLYALDIDDLTASANSLSGWIRKACALCAIEWEIDTAAIVENFVQKSGGRGSRASRF